MNIGNPAEMTVLEFAREIIRATGSRSKIVFQPLPQDDPRQRQPDISRARALLGWEPRVPLAEGLVKTIEYFRGKIEPKSGNDAAISRIMREIHAKNERSDGPKMSNDLSGIGANRMRPGTGMCTS